MFKRLQSNFNEIVEDVGGHNALSHAQLALIERFVFLETFIRNMEYQIAMDPKGQSATISRWIQAVNSLQGLARAFGLGKVQKRAIDLQAYIEEQAS